MDSIFKTPRSRMITFCVIITTLFSLVGHMYFFTSNAFTHDSLMVYTSDANWQISLGRFGNLLLIFLRGNANVPWLIGVCFIIFSCFSVYTLCKLFRVESYLQIASISAIIVLNPFVSIQIATYIQVADIYACAQWLVILSVYLLCKNKYGFLAGIGLIAFSMSLYAAYFALACMLCIFCFWRILLDEEKSFSSTLTYVGKVILMLVGGIIVYSVMNKLVLNFTGIAQLDSYNSISNAYNFNIDVLTLFWNTYTYFVTIVMNPVGIHPSIILVLNIALASILIIEFTLMIRIMYSSSNAWLYIISFVLSALLLPFACCIIYFINKRTVHGLMMSQFYYFFMIPIFINNNYKRKNSRYTIKLLKLFTTITMALILVLSWDGVLYSNSIYLNKRLAWERTESLATHVVDRIEDEEGYQPGITKVYISGTPDENPYYQQRTDSEYLYTPMSEWQNVGLSWKYSISYPAYWITYIHNVLLINMNLISPYEDHTALDPSIEQMPLFPAEDSIQWINDVLVVKVS